MGDRDPFRLPPSNPLLLNYLAQLNNPSTLLDPTLAQQLGQTPLDGGTGRAPTRQSAAQAYRMQCANEQMLMARLLQNTAPLPGRTGAFNADPERVNELGAELRVRVDGNEINDDDVERLTSLSTDERVAVLGTLDPAQLKNLGDQLPDQDDTKSGQFLAKLAEDAQTHPELVQGQFSQLLDGIKQDGSDDSDNVLQRMQETLGGGDVADEAHAAQASGVLARLGRGNLDKMADIHSGGNPDEKELAVIGRARAVAGGLSQEAAGISADLTKRLSDGDLDGDTIDRLSNASPRDRFSVLATLSPDQRAKLAELGTDHEDQMGNLMANVVQDVRLDPRAAQLAGELTNGLKDNHNRDDVLQHMQSILGGGDVSNSDNRRAAAAALAVLNPATLEKMAEIHEGGNRDDKELEVIRLAQELQGGAFQDA